METECKYTPMYCHVGNKNCRHLSVNIKVERVPVIDRFGHQVYDKGHHVFETKIIKDNREYCNDSGQYIDHIVKCPLECMYNISEHGISKNKTTLNQSKKEKNEAKEKKNTKIKPTTKPLRKTSKSRKNNKKDTIKSKKSKTSIPKSKKTTTKIENNQTDKRRGRSKARHQTQKKTSTRKKLQNKIKMTTTQRKIEEWI